MEKTTEARSPPLWVDLPANAGTLKNPTTTVTSLQRETLSFIAQRGYSLFCAYFNYGLSFVVFLISTWKRTIAGTPMESPGPGASPLVHPNVGNRAPFHDAVSNVLVNLKHKVLCQMISSSLIGQCFLVATEPPTIVPELTCTSGEGSSYRGTIAVTVSGKTCQDWASQSPQKHSRTSENYPCK